MELEITKKLKETYNKLDYYNLELLSEVYSEQVIFIDPFKRLEGLPALTHHFKSMYRNLQSIEFDYIDEITKASLEVEVGSRLYVIIVLLS